ncbi:MAG: MBL fold metallo-hydrolase [Halieaceae bacterium]|jgi:glyoxylase-like metal-dependent hydrolase (beta-lactamase superfamily II)|nr:MBL fold metallo-hydrolase [Halieaceae bacterium]
MNRVLVVLALVVVALGSGYLLLGGEQGLRKTVFAQAMPVTYFEPFTAQGSSLDHVAGPVYAFTSGFTRSMVIDTPEGLAVFDTFDAETVATMRKALARQFPDKPVKWVVYSHNHLDHVRGSADIEAREVIGHEAVNQFVADWPREISDFAPVTRPVAGDVTLNLGGVEVDFLYMPHSHSQTLYGFHVPDANVVFAPDMMFVRAFPPFDFPDFYYPGYIRALDRLIALEADHYIPSHLDSGTRQDLIDYRNMTAKFHETVGAELAGHDYQAADGAALRRSIKAAYDKLEPEYGDWHGFNEMFVPKFGRHWGGAYLGY